MEKLNLVLRKLLDSKAKLQNDEKNAYIKLSLANESIFEPDQAGKRYRKFNYGKNPIKDLYFFNKVDSTNVFASKIAVSEETDTLIVAKEQALGRGRKGRTFLSPKGGLYFSLIIRPKITAEKSPFISQITSIALYDALKELGVVTKIKWPNDILLEGKKLSGILTQALFEKDTLKNIIVGVGINCQKLDLSNEDFEAISLEECGYDIAKADIVTKFLEKFYMYLSMYENDDVPEIIEKLVKNSSVVGKRVVVIDPEEIYEAIAIDIDEKGALVVQKDQGEIIRLISQEVILKEVYDKLNHK